MRWPDFTPLSSLDVEHMSTPAIERALEQRVDLPSLKRDFRIRTCVFLSVGGCGKSPIGRIQQQLSEIESTWLLPFHVDGDTPAARRRSFYETLGSLGAATIETARSQPSFDTLWPYTDALQRLGRSIAHDRDLRERYAQSYLQILSDVSPGLGGYALTWAIGGLFDDPSSARVARRIATLITKRDAPVEARLTLALLSDTRPELRKALPRLYFKSLPPAATAAWMSFLSDAIETARGVCNCITHHRAAKERVAKLVSLMNEVRDEIPLYGMFAMASMRRALQSLGPAMRYIAPAKRQQIVSLLCELLFENVGRPGQSYYLAMEALEGLRVEMPVECETALAAVRRPPADAVFRDERFWSDNTKQLLAFATRRLQYRRWRGAFGSPPGAKMPEDYVQEAAMKILSGARRYDPASGSPLSFVLSVIDSMVSHDAARLENYVAHELIEMSRAAADAMIADPSPEETCAARDHVERFKQQLPPQCRDYVEAAADDPFGTLRDRAEALHVSPQEVRNLANQLRRRRALWEEATRTAIPKSS